MENAERLLLDSKSGHEFFKVVVDEGDREQFIIEKEITDKIPGKILNHRTINTGEIELLMILLITKKINIFCFHTFLLGFFCQ